MTNDIELKDSFAEYALNELVNKLHELEPEDYDNRNKGLNVSDMLVDLLLEDEETNGCYYIYTVDGEQVFKAYFKDILYICNNYSNIDLNAGTLLLVAMEHVFTALLRYLEHMIEVAGLKFDRAGLDTIATTLLDMYPAKIEDLIFN